MSKKSCLWAYRLLNITTELVRDNLSVSCHFSKLRFIISKLRILQVTFSGLLVHLVR